MTKEELVEYGYEPKNCKIGTLYFKGGFFCKFNGDDSVDFRYSSDDMTNKGNANTIDELKSLEKEYYVNLKQYLEGQIKVIDLILEEY